MLSPDMQRTILHIDFDSFFASVEQQCHPRLRNRPMGVTATNGRTCLIASSREAKKLSIGTGSRSWEATAIYPDIQLVPADFNKYFAVSKRFLGICQQFAPSVELFSMDEVFMDITHSAHLFGGVEGTIQQIKQRIKQDIGEYITVSIGVSHNKLLAKLASGLKKPNGVFFIRPQDVAAVYTKVPLTAICGIGNRICLRLNKIGIYTLLQLRQAPLSQLIAEFGKVEGQFLHAVGQGLDATPLVPIDQAPEVKSIGRNYCLPHNEYNQQIVLQNVYELCEEVALKLRRLGKKARCFGLYLRGNIAVQGRRTQGAYFDTGQDMFQNALSFVSEELYSTESYIRQISIWTSDLIDAAMLPASLFDQGDRKKRLWQAIDAINDRFGDHTIRNGFLLYADKLTTVPNGWMGDRFERTKLAEETHS